jgi:hypothetical protein
MGGADLASIPSGGCDMRIAKAVAVAAVCLSTAYANAALYSRLDGQAVYDSDLNITWLADANYAKTSGYDTDGLMNWSEAKTWAENLVYVGYSDWRLAVNTPVGANWNYNNSFDGSTDFGYNITSPHSELAYMYYVNLGLKAWYSPAGIYQSNYGVFGNGTVGGQADVGLVKNLQAYTYWSGTGYAPTPNDAGMDFHFYDGAQNYSGYDFNLYAWAVRDGDVSPVPEPETFALLLAGLGLVGLLTRRKEQKAGI